MASRFLSTAGAWDFCCFSLIGVPPDWFRNPMKKKIRRTITMSNPDIIRRVASLTGDGGREIFFIQCCKAQN
jgi:hypothetical protein